jgi:hypothetical protein
MKSVLVFVLFVFVFGSLFYATRTLGLLDSTFVLPVAFFAGYGIGEFCSAD